MDQYDQILTQAHELGEQRHPDAPAHHHAAFANSVAYGVTGASGGFGGPSMREHWSSRLLHNAGMPGQIDFDCSVKLVEDACYGALTLEMAQMLECEYCFDDAPGEQEEAQRLLSAPPFNPENN